MITLKYSLAGELIDGGVHTAEQTIIGPRNLCRLVDSIEPLRKKLGHQYGNGGLCRIWLEINGREVDPFDLTHLRRDIYESDRDCFKKGQVEDAPIAPTKRAKALIAEYAA